MQIDSTVKLNNGVKIPLLGFGTWQIADSKVCERAVLAALNAGYRHIDTAAIYGNESGVGSAIRKSGIPREEIFVTTKLWNDHHDDPVRALEDSLRRLGMDYVDLYLIHFPVPQRNASWKILEALHSRGKCRSIGVSNFTVRHLSGLLDIAGVVPAVNQVELHPYLYQMDLIDFCTKKGILVEAYSPLTHGARLSDPRLVALAARYGKSPAQLLVRWCLQKGLVVLPKSVREDRIAENADVFDFIISSADMAVLDGFNENLRTCWDPTDAP
ncbi:aldo/keto reductase [Candidatus Woesearchaeota archaeon]|nr:aldo/keto reductase [Candidatus Woesearchaeota archaeon]